MLHWFKNLTLLAAASAMLVATINVGAQEVPKPADKPAEKSEGKTAAKPASDNIVFPFEFDGLMFVQTKINGKGPYKFLFDSGATLTVLSDRLSKELELEEHDSPGGVQGVGNAEAKLVVLDSIEVGGFEKGKSAAATLNFDHISGGMGFHMMGIIGQNVIRLMKKIEIDFSTLQFTVTKYGEKEMPKDTDEMIINLLEGGGLGDLPGMPGMPEPKAKPKKEPEAPKGPKKEEEFSAPLGIGQWLWQDAAKPEQKAADKPVAEPMDGMTLSYTTVTLPILGEIVPLWTVKCEINGAEQRFMFDTGASSLLVLGDDLVGELGVTTSFTFPVKGIGTGEASAGILDSFSVGTFEATDIAAMTTKLPKMSDQLPEMAKAFLPMLEAQGIFLDFDGIIGLPLALKFRKLVINTKTKNLEFVPYAKGEVNKLDPTEGEEFVKEAVIRTWNAKASDTGLTGDSVPLDDWKKLELETGGLLVESVKAGSGAEKAGIKKGDIVTHLIGEGDVPDMEDAKKVNGNIEIRDMSGLIIWACSKDPGAEVTFRIKRDKETKDLKVKLDGLAWKGKVPERFKAK